MRMRGARREAGPSALLHLERVLDGLLDTLVLHGDGDHELLAASLLRQLERAAALRTTGERLAGELRRAGVALRLRRGREQVAIRRKLQSRHRDREQLP